MNFSEYPSNVSKLHKNNLKLLLDYHLIKLNRKLQDVQHLIQVANDDQYARENIIVTDTLLSLDNVRLFKSLVSKELSKDT